MEQEKVDKEDLKCDRKKRETNGYEENRIEIKEKKTQKKMWSFNFYTQTQIK